MRKLALVLMGGFVATGCGITEDEYTDEMLVLTCDKLFECTSSEDIEAMGDLWVFGADSAECQSTLSEGTEDAEEGEEAEAEPAGSAVDPFPHRQHRAPASRPPQTSAPFGSRALFPPCSHVRLRVLRPDPVQQQAETLAADQDRPLNGPAVGLCRRRPLGV